MTTTPTALRRRARLALATALWNEGRATLRAHRGIYWAEGEKRVEARLRSRLRSAADLAGVEVTIVKTETGEGFELEAKVKT